MLHGALLAILQDEEGQIVEAHSISAGLDYPGAGPEHALAARHRPRALRGGHRRAGARRVPRVARLEGIIPALETAHAIAWVLADAAGSDTLDLVCLSGRGDKDLAEVARAMARRERRRSSAIAAAFAGAASAPR